MLSILISGISTLSKGYNTRTMRLLHVVCFSGTLSSGYLDLCAWCRLHVVHVGSSLERDQFCKEQEAIHPKRKISC